MLMVEERIAVENREMELFGTKSIALIVLFDPDAQSDMDIIMQVYNDGTKQFEGEYIWGGLWQGWEEWGSERERECNMVPSV